MPLYLDSAGIRVRCRATVPAGLAAVRRYQPAAVVLDIRLPGMDGWHVLEELKADPVTAIPVVVVSILDERGRASPWAPPSTSSSRSAGRTCWRR